MMAWWTATTPCMRTVSGDPYAGATTNPKLYTTTGFYHQSGSVFAAWSRAVRDLRSLSVLRSRNSDVGPEPVQRIQVHGKMFSCNLELNSSMLSIIPTSQTRMGILARRGSFGKVTTRLHPILGTDSGGPGDPREIQFALKLYF